MVRSRKAQEGRRRGEGVRVIFGCLGQKGKVVTVIVRNYVNNIDHSCSSNYITMSNTDNSRNYRIQVYWLRARNCGVELMVVGFLREERQARRETKRDDTFDD